MSITLYRRLTHESLSKLHVHGPTLDLGGSKTSGYLAHLAGTAEITVVNLDEGARPDSRWDLEQTPYPFADRSYGTVLAINVLEHLWNWRGLLAESERLLVPGGEFIAVVPFLHAVHPSPHDYFRFSKEALAQACHEAGFADVTVAEIGKGVCVAAYSFFQRFLPSFLTVMFEPLALGLDALLAKTMRLLKKKYAPEDYPLGYLVTARKKS